MTVWHYDNAEDRCIHVVAMIVVVIVVWYHDVAAIDTCVSASMGRCINCTDDQV